ncbi:MAG TPA: alkaline phosphatase family protein [Solirubrobacteraceae bacterium]|nr:alkaline phosphatase family protein [Solirubrobacteraceae bacterium]
MTGAQIGPVTRRALLRGAAGGAALAATAGLPAWARPPRSTHRVPSLRRPDSRPFPHLPAGHASLPEIEHVIVLMMENHSFDNLLGMAAYQVPGRRGLDGLRQRRGRLIDVNRDAAGHPVHAARAASPCQLPAVPSQSWNASHTSWNHGRMDGFVRASGPMAMRYWDEHDLPFTYSLVRHYPIGQRYFCSVMAQTFPNRRFFFAGSASGTVDDKTDAIVTPPPNGTIWDRLDAHHIDWAVYYENTPSFVIVPTSNTPARAPRLRTMDAFFTAAKSGALPAFSFLEPNYETTSEENPQDIQVGERFVAAVVNAVTHSPQWKRTALFITWDEHGGYYDHVPPPRAIPPDDARPIRSPGAAPLAPGGFDRYGFRVPLIVVSPWARRNYVSNVVQDHTSLAAFLQYKWNLPAMTFRDANAAPMTDYFDFSRPGFAHPPRLAAAPGLGAGLAACHAQGLNPPLPPPL